MKKSQLPQGISLSTHHKDSKLPDPSTKKLVYLSVDIDTGFTIVNYTLANRKSEINPVGHYIIFLDSLKMAMQLKRKFDKYPYKVENYLKTL